MRKNTPEEVVAAKLKKQRYGKQYRKDHPELYREAHRRWASRNVEKERDRGRLKSIRDRPKMLKKRSEWGKKNRKHLADYLRAHRIKNRAWHERYKLNNRDKLLASQAKYKSNNIEKLRLSSAAHQHKRRAEKRNTEVNLKGIKRWMSQVRSLPFMRCHWCGTKVHGRQIHFDHVVALSRGGGHTIGNLCCSCQDCNRSKSSRLISDWVCNGQTFLTL